MKTAVYTLRFLSTDSLHAAGERMVVAAQEVNIGHTDGCEVRLSNEGPYVDEVLAVIRQNSMGEWILVKLSPYHELRVNGMPVHLVHQLHEADRIAWEGQRQILQFSLGNCGLEVAKGSVTALPRRLGRRMALWASIPALVLALVGGLVWWLCGTPAHSLTSEMIGQTAQSVYQINVDTIKLVRIFRRDTTVIATLALGEGETGGNPIVGTAFLTTDSLLVTARHCIEPWLNDPEVFLLENPLKAHFKPTRWALQAETFNQLRGESSDTLLKVVSVCSLWSYKGEQATFVGRVCSADFWTETSRDDVVDLGSYDQELYWLSIVRRHQRTDMMRDDVAALPWHQNGTIRMATLEEAHSALSENESALEFFGFPDYTDLRLEHTSDHLRRPLRRTDEDASLLNMLAHNGDLRHGYSGGPVMVRKGKEALCVGIVSVTDARGADRFYSVPCTEVWHLKKLFKHPAHENR